MVSRKYSKPAPSPADPTDRKLGSGKLYWMTQKAVLVMKKTPMLKIRSRVNQIVSGNMRGNKIIISTMCSLMHLIQLIRFMIDHLTNFYLCKFIHSGRLHFCFAILLLEK